MTYPLGDEVLDLRMQCARDTDEVARLRRGLQATHQALLGARAELERTGPVAAAAHAWCAEYIHRGAACDVSVFEALLAAHQATTPSETPPTHGIVAVDELNALRADNEHLRELLDQARDAEADAYHASYEAWLGRQDGAQ